MYETYMTNLYVKVTYHCYQCTSYVGIIKSLLCDLICKKGPLL